MHKTTYFLLAIIAILSAGLLITSKAKASDKSFTSVIPFSAGATLGFFNQSNGKIYLYDSTLSRCVFQGQIEELGKAINNTITSSYKSPSVSPTGIPVSHGSASDEGSS